MSDSWNYDYTGVSLHTYLLDHAQELKVSCLYAQPQNYNYNLIEAWKRLEKLLPSKMTKKQKETYKRYKMFLRTQMGSFHANELEMRRRAEAGEKIQRSTTCFTLSNIREPDI